MLAVNHDVEDYDRWKAAFDEFPPSLGGALFHRVNRRADNPNNITVVMGFESAAKAETFVSDPELKAAMQRAGVTSAPRIEIFEEVEVVQY
jgi:uncharacterized protein (DUF1330 family)